MKIAFCGVPGSGKTEVINKLLEQWPMYTKPNEKNVELFTKESRFDIAKLDKIHNDFVDEAMWCEGKSNIVHDGCVLDSIAHLYLFFAMHPEADDSIIYKYQGLVNACIRYYDIIFYIPFRTKFKSAEITDPEEFVYCSSLDNFYSSIQGLWKEGDNTLFPFDCTEGSPPLIEIFGTTPEKLALLKFYINTDGGAYGKDETLITPDIISGIKNMNIPDLRKNYK